MAESKPTLRQQLKLDISIYEILLVLLLLAGAYLRLTGINWDEGQHLHPDERFLTSVESGLAPVKSLGEYWDTDNSSLNPHNRGYGFFVYGTFPIFVVRYAAEWIGKTSYGDITLVGRALSAVVDLGVVFLVYAIATRLYDRRVGIVAAAFSTFTVMQIQLSHYFATDTFLNFFTFLCIYLAVKIATEGDDEKPFNIYSFLWFGVALGLAVASKVTTAPVAVALPLAVFIRVLMMDEKERYDRTWVGVGLIAAAAFVSLLVFRVFQPYAFSGPGFFGVSLNDKWMENLESLRSQATGDVDWPPSIQWARRPLWFSVQNMVVWGMGLPFGIVAWAGFLWVGWRMAKGEWKKHLVLWGWTAAYFLWQSMAFNPTMRYQLPTYPGLAVFAGWGVIALWDYGKDKLDLESLLSRLVRLAAAVLGAAALILTALYAFAFVQIYHRPVTRVAASTWIYQNIPGPMTLSIDTGDGIFHQPMSVPYNTSIRSDSPYITNFIPNASGTLTEVRIKYVQTPPQGRTLILWIADAETPDLPMASMTADFQVSQETAGASQQVVFSSTVPILFAPGKQYQIRIEPVPGNGQITLQETDILLAAGEDFVPQTLNLAPLLISPESPFVATFGVEVDSVMTELYANVSVDVGAAPEQQALRFYVGLQPDLSYVIASAVVAVDVSEEVSEGYTFKLDRPVEVTEGNIYYVQVVNETPGGSVSFLGSAISVEAPWDDGLPLRTDYDGYGGVYQLNLNLDMYADDNPQKLDSFIQILDKVEFITISSSRQWASTTRIPERYPLNVQYYQHLLGCPENRTIEWCYNVADVGMFSGDLGFELVQVFQSDPSLGSFSINDQFSEEAFTVYDHPKVFIFQKTDDYSHANTVAILGAVDFDSVIRLTPKQASKYDGGQESSDLLLPEDALAVQQAGGTWSELFNVDSLVNRNGFMSFLVWYLAVFVLGLAAYPTVRFLLPGLSDRGYPLSRIAGLLLLSYFSWAAGSLGGSFSRATIAAFFGLIVVLGLVLGYIQREELAQEFKEKLTYFGAMEILFAAFFILSLVVRLGNPDLWHPFKGGEKPMDFSYFNAVIKSTTFPPYDPWFAGGYINYYYYGFVYVGTLVKLLGIVPATAYNLIIPTLFAFLSMGAFSVGWNLIVAVQDKTEEGDGFTKISPYWVGSAAALGTAFLGNLGSLRMIFWGYQRMGAAEAFSQEAFFLTKWWWAFKGMFNALMGQQMPYGLGDWYWIPSRVIPAPNDVEPITEFPWFTFIYADLHAHMMALAIAALVLAWALSVALGGFWREKTNPWQIGASIVFGALAIGALWPTNTWDYPTYLALSVVLLIYSIFRYKEIPDQGLTEIISKWYSNDYINVDLISTEEEIQERNKNKAKLAQKVGLAVLLSGLLVGFSLWLFSPYRDWYVQGYTIIDIWEFSHTPTNSYLTHWGLFLFVIVSWLAWETRQWLANTPASAVHDLEKLLVPIIGILLAMGIAMLIFHFGLEVRVYWIVLPLGLWSAVLMFRKDLPDAKRVVLFMTGTALFLTLFVELVVLSGDIGRMNTVFKFYLQAWVLFAVSAAAAGGWLFSEMRQWNFNMRVIWQVFLALLLAAAALFPIIGTGAKVRDRMAADAPYTLDGMAFMPYSEYADLSSVYDLSQDYQAIQWLQQNVAGSPVIVEGHTPEYRWGNRMTIYTGLPSVLGWRNHQNQQRIAGPPEFLPERAEAIPAFYNTTDADEAAAFLETYGVKYVIVGQLERTYYPGPGLAKFELLDGVLWQEVFRVGDTVIYKVIE